MSAPSAWAPLPACSDVESRGRGWLLENMQLLGLDADDKGRSLFTCVKELFETVTSHLSSLISTLHSTPLDLLQEC